MNAKQAGFTLIELVMVIVILGILAAVAVPKFVDLSTEARVEATKGVAGAITAGFATNYAVFVASSAKAQAITGTALNVTAAANSVMLGGIPNGYSLYSGGTGSTAVNCGSTTGVSAGSTFSVGVSNTGGTQTATATLICT